MKRKRKNIAQSVCVEPLARVFANGERDAARHGCLPAKGGIKGQLGDTALIQVEESMEFAFATWLR